MTYQRCAIRGISMIIYNIIIVYNERFFVSSILTTTLRYKRGRLNFCSRQFVGRFRDRYLFCLFFFFLSYVLSRNFRILARSRQRRAFGSRARAGTSRATSVSGRRGNDHATVAASAAAAACRKGVAMDTAGSVRRALKKKKEKREKKRKKETVSRMPPPLAVHNAEPYRRVLNRVCVCVCGSFSLSGRRFKSSSSAAQTPARAHTQYYFISYAAESRDPPSRANRVTRTTRVLFFSFHYY